ncbi:MAG: prenyltransferase [Candidatus Methanospirareceae archaeon]
MNEQPVAGLKVWLRAFRYHFVPPSMFPAAIGALVSWAVDQTFSLWFFFLVMLGVSLNHIALNMTDDYFDFKHAVDQLTPDAKNPYTGGSGLLTSWLMKPSAMYNAFVVMYCGVAVIGLYLGLVRGLLVLVFVTIGVLSSIFYTAPPIKFSHRGLGELGLLLNFGPIIGLGSYFVQAQQLSLEAFLATLPCGIMLFSMVVINEIPDLDDDKKAGKLTLVARYGTQTAIKLYGGSWVATYLVIILGVAARVLTPFALLAVLALPLTYRSLRILLFHHHEPQRMVPANLAMIKSHSVTSLLLIGAYALEGLVNGSDGLQLIGLVLVLFAFYLPAALAIFRAPQTA